MEPEVRDYKLSCQLQGHEEDVRGICICGDFGIATSSRDKTVRFWCKEAGEIGYKLEKTLIGHTSFVGPIAWFPPNNELPRGGLVSGGMDTLVIVWNLENSLALKTLQGHDLQITSVLVDEEGDIISASIDSTVRRWRRGETVEVLRGHSGPVQAMLKLPSGEIITGSSDSTLKIWRGTTCVQTFSGHSDTVRGLALMPNLGVLSASHDGSVRLWAFTGDPLLEMVGHTAIVYCVAAHSSGDVASGSEDCFVKVWRNGACCQSIQHPGCVWDVKFLPNGDIITACSDGVARIWTRDHSRFAPPEEIEIYEANIAARKSQMKMVGGINVKDLPGIEALQQPGTKNGQTKIFREGDNGVAYSWNAKEYRWDKIGEVVDGPDSFQDKSTLNGMKYDYVFDVDIGDGEPTRKLPYNRGDNPYIVADQWLLSENLPLSYRQQVVDFILQNTGRASPVFDSSFVDPYTGANAYVPSQQQSWKSGLLTSDGASNPSHVQSHTLKHVPKKSMLLFDVAQYDAIHTHTYSTMVFWEGYMSDEVMGTIAPILVYWLYSSLYHLLQPLDRFRMHSRKEEESRNLVSLPCVLKGVVLQQAIQALVAILLFTVTGSAGPAEMMIQPSLPTQVGQFLVAMLVMDTWQYFVHRYMHHSKYLYRHVHSQHHKLVVPYAFGALYNHPLEGLLLDTVGGAISFLVSGMTPRTSVFFFSFATIKTVDDHCGLWLPGNPFHMFFQNNTAYHDIHHQLYGAKYNFSQPFFVMWDKLLGTYMPYTLEKRVDGGFEAVPAKD